MAKGPGGRPTKFNDTVRKKILDLISAGKTETQICEILGISWPTLRNWKLANSEFFMAMREHKQEADEMVEASLWHRAVGYSHEAVKIFYDSKTGETVEHKYIEHHPPDVTAASLWLRNRKPKEWRDKQEVDFYGEMNQQQNINIEINTKKIVKEIEIDPVMLLTEVNGSKE